MKQICAVIRRFLMAGAVTSILALAATAQTESILYSFTGGSDGAYPQGGLTPDGKGNYFGVAGGGGSGNAGVVFEFSPNSSGGWTEKVIYNFTGFTNFSDGALPSSAPVFDSKGNLYGVTETGGVSGAASGLGTVFEFTPNSNGTWTEKVLYSFKGLNDGASPFGSPVVLDSGGNLYGVGGEGGAHDYGVVYELTPGTGGTWTEKVLYSFPAGAGGAFPVGNLVLDSSGNLFGATFDTAFELERGSTGKWTPKILHRFAGGTDGANPEAGMVFDKAGNLYGMTSTGGAHRGIVYELSPATTGTWTEKILHRFASNGTDGYAPVFSNVTVDASGNVFGTTGGGTSGHGVIFEIKP